MPLNENETSWFRETAQTFRESETTKELHPNAVDYLRERDLAFAIIADQDEFDRHRYTILADDANRRFHISFSSVKKLRRKNSSRTDNQALIAKNIQPDTILEAQLSSTHTVAEPGKAA